MFPLCKFPPPPGAVHGGDLSFAVLLLCCCMWVVAAWLAGYLWLWVGGMDGRGVLFKYIRFLCTYKRNFGII